MYKLSSSRSGRGLLATRAASRAFDPGCTLRLSSPLSGIRRLHLLPSGQPPSVRYGERRYGRGWRWRASWLTRGRQASRDPHQASARPAVVPCGNGLQNRRQSSAVPPQHCSGSRHRRRLQLQRCQSRSSRERFLYLKNRWTAPHCPSSDNLRLIRHFEKRDSGSSGVRV
jgi:hypothetical protein